MEEQEIRSKWDVLAREIGAEIPSERQESDLSKSTDPTATTGIEPSIQAAAASQRHPKPRSAPPKRSATDWSALNAQLGLEPTPAEPLLEQPGQPKSPPKSAEPAALPPKRRAKGGSPSEQRRTVAVAAEAARDISRAAGGEAPEEDLVKTSRRAVEREVEEPAAEPTVEPEPAKSTSISLWHKIFGLPADQTAKMADTAPKEARDEEAAEERPRDRDAAREGGETLDISEPWAASTVEGVELGEEAEPGGLEPEQPAADERPRRGRRRRRGRRSAEARTADRQPPPEDRAREDRYGVEEDDIDGEDEPAARRRERPRRATKDRIEVRDEVEVDRDEAEEKRAPTRSAAHRNIPSWEEAIGTIVDLNLQSRAERKQASHPSARTGSARGRVRGRRRKKS